VLYRAYFNASFINVPGLGPLLMAIKYVGDINLHPKELVHKAKLIADGFEVHKVPKWGAVLTVVENFEHATLSTRKQEAELLNGVGKGAWALNEVAVAP